MQQQQQQRLRKARIRHKQSKSHRSRSGLPSAPISPAMTWPLVLAKASSPSCNQCASSSISLQPKHSRSSWPRLILVASSILLQMSLGCTCWWLQAHAPSACPAQLGNAGASDGERGYLILIVHGDVEVAVGSSHHAPRHLHTHTSVAAAEA